MSKRKIGSLKGYPIIEGDMNLKKKNEIHISQLIKNIDSTPDNPDEQDYTIASKEDIDDVCANILGI
ncbi:MAG: hypothetical protein K2G70_00475 [Turicibacter sp.]|nr:hypothetical protein [Turicibacter sp.]